MLTHTHTHLHVNCSAFNSCNPIGFTWHGTNTMQSRAFFFALTVFLFIFYTKNNINRTCCHSDCYHNERAVVCLYSFSLFVCLVSRLDSKIRRPRWLLSCPGTRALQHDSTFFNYHPWSSLSQTSPCAVWMSGRCWWFSCSCGWQAGGIMVWLRRGVSTDSYCQFRHPDENQDEIWFSLKKTS